MRPHSRTNSRTNSRTASRSTSHSHTRPTTKRHGFVLATVVVAILLVALLAATIQSATLRADRTARLGYAGEHALHAADAAIAQRLSTWNARDFAAMDIGTRDINTRTDAQGLTADIVLTRTNGTSAWIEATVRNTRDGNFLPARRRVARFVTLENPTLPHAATVSSLGRITLDDPSSVSGVDQTPPGWTTDCMGIDSSGTTTPISTIAFLPSAPFGATILSDSTAARTLFDAQWNSWRERAAATDVVRAPLMLIPDDVGGRCTPGTGDPWRNASASSACTHEWGARLLTSAGTPSIDHITITGSSRYQGVLMIDGDLDVDGDLRIDGFLLVRGAINSTPGRLTVNGSLLVRDEAGHGSRLGMATRIQYSRCAMHRALAATGNPSVTGLRTWFERP